MEVDRQGEWRKVKAGDSGLDVEGRGSGRRGAVLQVV